MTRIAIRAKGALHARCLTVNAMLLATSLLGAPATAQEGRREVGGSPADTRAADSFAFDLSAGRLVLPRIIFDPGGTRIDPSSAGTLRALAAALHRTTGTYLVEAHTSPGRDAQALSDRRAAAVRTWLIAAGVDASRLYAAGFGATHQRTPPNHATARQPIDRVEISRVS